MNQLFKCHVSKSVPWLSPEISAAPLHRGKFPAAVFVVNFGAPWIGPGSTGKAGLTGKAWGEDMRALEKWGFWINLKNTILLIVEMAHDLKIEVFPDLSGEGC